MENKKIVCFLGKEYELVGKYYFEKNTTNKSRKKAKQLHKAVWEHYHGQEVPRGYHIHHIDFNCLNNDINNLVCIEAKKHLSLHAKRNLSTPEKKEKNKKQLDEARQKAIAWHKSPEGRAWHREHAKNSILKNKKNKML